ncbi:reverse transcriptase [Corchorus capsularis]|uniref:Reverse transcriptase n=1 Tax=Corchorus capsularis TaxID=210143 RepID=A0A1R3GLF3_COCAP|nr:reverse transcriptase [Corchorus capsularis]
MKTSELGFDQNTKVVDLGVIFPTATHLPQTELWIKSYGQNTERSPNLKTIGEAARRSDTRWHAWCARSHAPTPPGRPPGCTERPGRLLQAPGRQHPCGCWAASPTLAGRPCRKLGAPPGLSQDPCAPVLVRHLTCLLALKLNFAPLLRTLENQSYDDKIDSSSSSITNILAPFFIQIVVDSRHADKVSRAGRKRGSGSAGSNSNDGQGAIKRAEGAVCATAKVCTVSSHPEDSWRITGFYGRPEASLRSESWGLLRLLKSRSSLPWLCASDFNEVTSIAEKQGVSEPLMTWSRRINGNMVSERLDRGLVTDDWFQKFGASVERHLISTASDHLLLLISDAEVFEQTKREFEDLSAQEETLWRQRSKALWLRDGDKNTRFFHNVASFRHRRNEISGLQDSLGILDRRVSLDMNASLNAMFTPLDMNASLDAMFTPDEVKKAVFQMQGDTAPGPDGMSPLCFQNCWNIIEDDLCKMVLAFLNDGHPLPEINHTNIALVPKVSSLKTAKDFRPISLCNVIYKIISKMLANRLQLVLPNIISQNQSAFVPDRMIFDNAIIAFETTHFMSNKRTGRKSHMALKLDLSKAYDRVEWKFLETSMIALGFSSRWVALVMECVSSVSYSVLVNGRQCEKFFPTRGIRQGDPLSPYLFLFCMEALSKMISTADEQGLIQGIAIARQAPRVSHLFFADDSLLFLRASIADCDMVLQILRDFEAASGQQINIDKSSIMFSANVPTQDKLAIMNHLGVQRIIDRNKYLGLPVMIGEPPFAPRPREGLVPEPLCVLELIDFEQRTWRLEKLEELFEEDDICRILCLPIPREPSPDRLIWNGSSLGIFSVRFAYMVARIVLDRMVQPMGSRAHFCKIIWSSHVAPKLDWVLWFLWSIWSNMNRRLHSSTCASSAALAIQANRFLSVMKINSDASFCAARKEVGLGVVIRDSGDGIVASASRLLYFVSDSLYVEVHALLFAFELALEFDITNCIIESDSLVAVNEISKSGLS